MTHPPPHVIKSTPSLKNPVHLYSPFQILLVDSRGYLKTHSTDINLRIYILRKNFYVFQYRKPRTHKWTLPINSTYWINWNQHHQQRDTQVKINRYLSDDLIVEERNQRKTYFKNFHMTYLAKITQILCDIIKRRVLTNWTSDLFKNFKPTMNIIVR